MGIENQKLLTNNNIYYVIRAQMTRSYIIPSPFAVKPLGTFPLPFEAWDIISLHPFAVKIKQG